MKKRSGLYWRDLKSEVEKIADHFIKEPNAERFKKDLESLAKKLADRLAGDNLSILRFLEKCAELMGSDYEEDIKGLVDCLADEFSECGFDKPGRKNMMGYYLY